MLLLVVLVLEDPVAEVAREGGTYSVVGRLHVGVQAALPLEASLAELTLDCVDSAVATHVDPEAAFAFANFGADLADVPV